MELNCQFWSHITSKFINRFGRKFVSKKMLLFKFSQNLYYVIFFYSRTCYGVCLCHYTNIIGQPTDLLDGFALRDTYFGKNLHSVGIQWTIIYPLEEHKDTLTKDWWKIFLWHLCICVVSCNQNSKHRYLRIIFRQSLGKCL